jgi:hypothetical protein
MSVTLVNVLTLTDVGAVKVYVGAGATSMLNATAVEVPAPFVAVTLKLTRPAAVGVPEITPLLSNVSPAGSEPITVQLVGLCVAERILTYIEPTVAPVNASGGVMITGAKG